MLELVDVLVSPVKHLVLAVYNTPQAIVVRLSMSDKLIPIVQCEIGTDFVVVLHADRNCITSS